MKPPVRRFTLNHVYNRAAASVISAGQYGISRQATRPWICQQCRHQTQLLTRNKVWTTRRPVFETKSRFLVEPSPKSQVRRASSSDYGVSPGSKSNDVQRSSRTELPSQEEGRRSHVSKRFSHLMDHVQSNIFIAGQRLNDLTGYSGIEALKKDIEDQEELVRQTRSTLQKAKEAYSNAINQRSASQREVNELLQRKHAWSAQDLERFTSLYRSDHANEQSESIAKEAVTVAERESEEAAAKLAASILARYHEEQIWSDKIRRMSTWGTWGLMGMNVLLFLVFQIGVEPWRRKRLVKGFEDKVMEALEREGAAMNAATGAALAAVQAGQTPQASSEGQEVNARPATVDLGFVAPVNEVPSTDTASEADSMLLDASILPEDVFTGAAPPSTLQVYKESFRDMFGQRQISIRRVDLTVAALEGAAIGAAFVSILVAILRQR